jgi:hypothetical protein
MRRGWVLGGAALAAAAVTARADLGPPRRDDAGSRAPVVAPLRIVTVRTAAEARIELPRALAAPGRRDRAGEPAPVQTALAGTFLSLGIAAGGLWLVRRRRGEGSVLLPAVAAGLLACAAASAGWANMAPAGLGRPAPVAAPPVVEVRFTDAPEIRLHLTPEQVFAATGKRVPSPVLAQPQAGPARAR